MWRWAYVYVSLFLNGWTQFKYTFGNEIPQKKHTTHNRIVIKYYYYTNRNTWKIEDKKGHKKWNKMHTS